MNTTTNHEHGSETMPTNELRISGDTYPSRDTFRSRGWTWVPQCQAWVLEISAADAAAVRDETTRVEKMRDLKARIRGCRTVLVCGATIGEEVYRSPEFRMSPSPLSASAHIHAGDEYAHDAAGNYCPGRHIPGSAPEDCI